MLSRARLVTWLLGLVCTVHLCCGQEERVSLDPNEFDKTVEAIIDLYSGVTSSRVALTNTLEESWTSDSVVFDDGEFVVQDWETKEGSAPRLSNLVCASDGMLRVTLARPRYFEDAMPAGYLDAPGQVHHWVNPWPLLDEWCVAIGKDPGHTATRSNGITVLASPELGLSLTFGERLECLAVETTRKGFRSRIAFTGYPQTTEQKWPLPTGMRRYFYVDPSDPDKPTTDEWVFTNISFNTDDKARAFAWDPDKYPVYRYDPATKNIYASDGSLMYNEDEYSERIMRMAGLAGKPRRWLTPSLIALAVVLGAVAYWRIRRRGREASTH